MYQVSEDAKALLESDHRKFSAKLIVGDDEIVDGIMSLKQYQQSVNSNYISIGDTVASYVEVSIYNENAVRFENKEIDVYIGVDIDDNNIEYIPLGVFTAEKPKNNGEVTTFTAYDRFYSKMSGAYKSSLEYPADGKSVLREISTQTGVPVDVSNLPDGVMVNKKKSYVEMTIGENGQSVQTIKYENPYDGYSHRDVVGFVSQLYCKFATVNRNGTVVFRWYSEDSGNISSNGFFLDRDKYYDDFTVNETMFSVHSITCVVDNKTLGSGTGISSIQLENPVMTQEQLDSIYEKTKNLSYYPISLSFFGDPRLELGDCITVYDENGEEFLCPVMYILQDFDGGIITNIASYGRTQQEENSSKSPTKQKLEQLESDIAVVKELVGKKANFDEIVSKMITTDKVLFDNMTIVEFYNQIIEVNSSLEKTINGLSLAVSSLSTKKNITDNSEIQSYNVKEIPTLNNYPTSTLFFIYDLCSDLLYCSETLICGTNDYDRHLDEIAYNQNNGLYYAFEKNTDNVYGWRQLSDEEVEALADKYASVTVGEGTVSIVAGREQERCDVKITSDGMRATTFYCC